MANNLPYGIVEDAGVSITLAESIASDARVDDVFNALTWRLAREPEAGTIVEYAGVQYRLAVLRSIKEAENPTVAVRYSVDHNIGRITIHWAKVYPYDAATAYSPEEFGGS